MIKNIKKIFYSAITSLGTLGAGEVLAADQQVNVAGRLNNFARNMGFIIVDNGQTPQQRIASLVGVIINIILGFLGIIFMLLMIYAGMLWMTARGDETQITKAKNIFKSSVTGLIIVLLAYAAVFALGSMIKGAGVFAQ